MFLDAETAAIFYQTVTDSMDAVLRRDDVRASTARDGHNPLAWAAARDGGWLDVLLPEALGGAGLGISEYAPIITAAGARLFGEPLIESGATVSAIASLGTTHAEALRTAAQTPVAIADAAATGDHLPLAADGTVTAVFPAVRFGAVASHLLLAYVDSGQPCVSLVTSKRPGVEVKPCESFDPYSGYAELRINGLRPLPREMLASGEEAATLLDRVRASVQLLAAAELSGVAASAMSRSIDYARQRRQFGQEIGSFQAIQQILAGMVVRVHALEALCRKSASRADQAPSDLRRVGSVAKAYGCLAAREVVEAALQIHGGIAFTREFPLGSYYTHALALAGLYGDHRQLSAAMGEHLLAGELTLS